jgi:DNA polymerase
MEKKFFLQLGKIISLYKEYLEEVLREEDILVEGRIINDSLEEIKKKIFNCQRCRLHLSRKNIVFGVGNRRAKLLIVGEAPGLEEDIKGEPFVGKAGELLTRMLKAIEINRDEVYITNVVKCRPPENRNPQKDEISSCREYLNKQLNIIKPKIILALGNFAAQTLLNTNMGITRLRGKLYIFNEIKLIATYHPAAILRNPMLKREAWSDLKLLKKEYQEISNI